MARSRTSRSTTTDAFTLGVIGDRRRQGICGSGLVDLLSELRRTGRMNEMGRFEDGADRIVLDRRARHLPARERRQRARAGQGRERRGPAHVFSHYGIDFDDIDVFYLAGGFGRHLKVDASKRIGLIPESAGRPHRPRRQRGDRRRVDRAAVGREARGARSDRQARRALPSRDASGFLRFLRLRLPVHAGRGVGQSMGTLERDTDLECPRHF